MLHLIEKTQKWFRTGLRDVHNWHLPYSRSSTWSVCLHCSGLSLNGNLSCCVEDAFLSLSLSLFLSNTPTFLCGLTPECVQVSCATLSKESGGWKEAVQHISSWAGTYEDRHKDTHAGTHFMPGRRQNVRAGSGRQLLVLLSAWRLLWCRVAAEDCRA